MYNFSETLKWLQVVISVPASGKFYQLSPDKENTVTAVNKTAATKTAIWEPKCTIYRKVYVYFWFLKPDQANPPLFQNNSTAFSSSTNTLMNKSYN